jgi:ubiquinone/menaquinone biosynthesis C-methylase UbiE
MRQPRWRPLLVERARAAGATRVLDLGCGTGAMSIALARGLPDARVIGTDADPAAVAEARRVLAPGGRLVICDVGRAQDPLMRGLFLLVQVLDGSRRHARTPTGSFQRSSQSAASATSRFSGACGRAAARST